MDDLFAAEPASADAPPRADAPLAARFRPRTLEEYVGQSHLLAPGKPLRRLIEADRLTSLILFGPPGVGKTSLAEVIAHRTECHFERLNGVESSVADLRRVLGAAVTRRKANGRRTVLFIDEIHRFNKAQQDVLLPDVEAGSVRLIGATTHNPSFYINGPLVSRSQIFQLEPLEHRGTFRPHRPRAGRCRARPGQTARRAPSPRRARTSSPPPKATRGAPSTAWNSPR